MTFMAWRQQACLVMALPRLAAESVIVGGDGAGLRQSGGVHRHVPADARYPARAPMSEGRRDRAGPRAASGRLAPFARRHELDTVGAILPFQVMGAVWAGRPGRRASEAQDEKEKRR